MSKLLIRNYKASDKPQLYPLFKDFLQYFVDIDPLKRCLNSEKAVEESVRHLLKKTRGKKGVIFVSVEDGNIVGLIAGSTRVTPGIYVVSETVGEVIELYVAPHLRGQGFGHELFAKMEDYFKEKGCKAVFIEVFGPNKPAADFYTRHGYAARNVNMMKLLT